MNQPPTRPTLLLRLARLGRTLLLAATATLAVMTASMPDAVAMDTDIFGATTSSGAAPNVLIILDNTSNWSRQDQHFPGGISQGQAEVRAIQNAISALPGNINVGLLEYASGGSRETGGYVRYAISPMGMAQGTIAATNRTNFSSALTTIFNGITNPDEKLSSGVQYGDLMYDAYNYLAGRTPFATPGNVPSSLADPNGYTTRYSMFKSPLSDGTSCATTYIIFIGNPPSRGPTADSATNLSNLQTAGGNTTQLPLPNFTASAQNLQTDLGYSSACFTTPPTTTPTDYGTQCTAFDSCSYKSTDSTSILPACTTGARYSVISTSTTQSVYSSPVATTSQNSGTTNSCYAASTAWNPSTDAGGLASCPAPTSTTVGNVTTNTTYTCSYAASTSPNTVASASCSPATTTSTAAQITSTAQSNSCYANLNNWSATDHGTLSCPAPTTTTNGGTTTKTTYACTYSASATGGSTSGCNGQKSTMLVTQTATPTVTVTGPTYKYPVTQTVTKTVQTVTKIPGNTQTTLGNTLSCYASAASCSTSDYVCPAGSTCSCSSPTTVTGSCPAGGSRYQVVGNTQTTVEAPTNPPTYSTDTNTFNSDEWARFLHEVGVPVGTGKQTVNTYTIDVYNAQPDAGQSSLLASMARAGGGKYFTATNESAILSALTSIFSEVQAVNDTFSSAALPISATNRAQNSNQVYIGMFRPDQGDHPRWYGNLKRYQVSNLSGFSGLAGMDGKAAVSASTGFVTPCAVSWWTTDSGSYWYDTNNNTARIYITQATTAGSAWTTAGDDSNFAKGTCGNFFPYSDMSDGPTVEKGAAAEMLRTQASRNLYTAPVMTSSGGSVNLTSLTTSTTGISSNSIVNANLARFILGQDVTGEIGGVPSTAARPSIHGEVIHSRPLPVDYGGNTGVVIYYGAGDGVYHAVSGATGQELWGFVAPETYPQLQRLMDNSPLVQMPYPTPPGSTAVSGTTPKQFFFDGSTGVYQNADNSKVWIYPAMRRGGRMLYAFDVTTATAPRLKWRAGCPNLADDTNCTSGLSGIGQTWSTPQIAKVNGYRSSGTNAPVMIVGGGYDGCEDADSATPACSNPKGAGVYVLDADTGTVLASFATTRSVVADVALVDTNSDGLADAAYAADLGGNLYRVDFPSAGSGPSDWTMKKVAYTNVTPSNKYRKFEFAPAVLPYQGKVFVSLVSGDREHPLAVSYPYTSPVVNRAYVYLDDPSRTTATDLDGPLMQDNTITPATCNTSTILPGTTNVGWHLDLNAYGRGEQGVTSAIIIGGMVSFSTNRPVVSGQTCTSSLGEARGYWVNLLNGSGAIGVSGTCGGDLSQTFVGGGLPPSPVAATVNVDGSQQTIVIGATCRDGSNCSPIQAQQVRPPISNKRKRTYWRTNSDNR